MNASQEMFLALLDPGLIVFLVLWPSSVLFALVVMTGMMMPGPARTDDPT